MPAIIDWTLSAAAVANPDGSHAAITQGTTEVPGPGPSALGALNTALHFGAGATCHATVSPGSLDATRFTVRVAFRVTAPVTARGNLAECTALPFAIYVDAGAAPDRFNVGASVANGQAGWTQVHTANRVSLLVNQWYIATLAYDLDTLALLIDGTVISVSAFPRGGLQASSGDQLHVGTWVDGARWPLTGDVAAVQLWRDLPADVEARLDAERGGPEWHLTRKENEVRPTLNLGPKTGDHYFDTATSTWIQPFALAVVSYTEAHGVAFVMYGVILARWRTDETLRRALGGLASDELPGRRAGSRKSVFDRGALYWSPATGAVPVLNRMYLDYEQIGEGSSAIGLPVADVESIAGGRVQRFQSGKMYWRSGGSNAYEVHGAILAKYDAAGGPARWGFPIAHEGDVLRDGRSIGRVSEFQNCTIFWSPRSPASIIYGAIRERYLGSPAVTGEGGPAGDLGFPTSDEQDIPGAAGARHNTFENGSILWFGGPIHVCRAFNLALGRLDTKEEDRDAFDLDGQNDLYARVCVDVNGGRVFDRKYPEAATHYPSANIRDLNLNVPYTVTPNRTDLRVNVQVQVWESDNGQLFAGGDDHLGTMTAELNIANAWGLRNNNGLFRASNFGPWVNYLDWSVKPRVVPGTPRDFFGVTNACTHITEWREYAAAFSDVDPDPEVDFGFVDDALKNLYYDLVVKQIASGGNCFGMSLEAVYAWKNQSRLGAPLKRFDKWDQVENDFNVRHAYQAGADAIWWMVGQFVTGQTHDPVGVFQSTWDAFARGEHPVVCIAQNYDFSGAPHCVVPISWNRNVTPWEMGIFDPNFPNQPRVIKVDPAANRYRYDGSNDGSRIYTGDAWNGGRLHYIPWGVLNHRQRTPVWDAILLLLGGVVMLFGDSTEVLSLQDERNQALDGASARDRSSLASKLLRIPGLSTEVPLKGCLYVGRAEPQAMTLRPELIQALRLLPGSLGQGGAQPVPRIPSPLGGTLGVPPSSRAPVATTPTAGTLSGPALMALARQDPAKFLRTTLPSDLDTIRARLRGKSAGRLDAYLKRGLQGLHVQGQVKTGDLLTLNHERIGSRTNELLIQGNRAGQYTVGLSQRLGIGKDHLKVTLNGLASQADQALKLNVQPGLGTIDVLAAGAPTQVRVTIEGMVAGRAIRSDFDTTVDGGQRLSLSDPSDPSRLKVGRIDQLQGQVRQSSVLLKR